MLFGAIRLMFGRNSSVEIVASGSYIGRSITRVGHHLAEARRRSRSTMHGGHRDAAQRAQRDRSRSGSIAADDRAASSAARSSGAGRRAAAAVRRRSCEARAQSRSASLKRVASALSVAPGVGVNADARLGEHEVGLCGRRVDGLGRLAPPRAARRARADRCARASARAAAQRDEQRRDDHARRPIASAAEQDAEHDDAMTASASRTNGSHGARAQADRRATAGTPCGSRGVGRRSSTVAAPGGAAFGGAALTSPALTRVEQVPRPPRSRRTAARASSRAGRADVRRARAGRQHRRPASARARAGRDGRRRRRSTRAGSGAASASARSGAAAASGVRWRVVPARPTTSRASCAARMRAFALEHVADLLPGVVHVRPPGWPGRRACRSRPRTR